MNRKSTLFILLSFLIFSGLSLKSFAQLPEVKIDFNMSGRSNSEVNEPNYTPWAVTNGGPDSITVNGIKFVVKKGVRGRNLAMTWWKEGVQSPNLARLVNDGIFVMDDDFALGSEIELRIQGLPAGKHSLISYHNSVENIDPAAICPINIFVDGQKVVDKLKPSKRVLKTVDAKVAELSLSAEEGRDVVILFQADLTGDQAVKNVIINGLQLNGVYVGKKAHTPNPADRNEHVEMADDSYLIRWSAAPAVLSHDVYFGTDSMEVANADHNSPLFRGNQALADTSYQLNGLYSMKTYFWRIDELTSTETVKGEVWMFRRAQLAFPGAEGYGRFARGGRGGKVVEVTNLNDSGPGSLREAINNDIGPRTIVFAVSGVISLESRLILNQPHITIAGQTAPGKGICIRKAPLGVTGNDAVVRHVRVRLGGGPTYDGMGLTGNNHAIIDHCSISWTIDEAFSSRGGRNITLQRTLISEALNAAGHQNYPAGTEHGYAATIGGDVGSFHHNLLAHCYGRNWSMGGGLAGGYYSGRLDIRNNVVYNWGSRTTDGGAMEVNFVNNYYKPGAGSTRFYALTIDHENTGMGMQRAYFSGNVMPGVFNESNQEAGRTERFSNGDYYKYPAFVDAPFFPSFVTTQSAYQAYKEVMSDVGCTQPVFDDHDNRIVKETLDGTYTYTGSVTGKKGFPDNEADVGGYESYPEVHRIADWDTDHDGLPNWWEKIHGTNINSAPGDFSDTNQDADMDGFTSLDAYLEWMANPHYSSAANSRIDIDLKKLARGFTLSPSFSVSGVVNGEITLNAGVAGFTPSAEGLGSFLFTVTDQEGASMTRKVNLLSGQDLTLPVNLLSFDAKRKSPSAVVLKWKTAQEINNDHFEVQRRLPAEADFSATGAVIKSKAVSGTSMEPLSYETIDLNSFGGESYYRIAQKDKDGKSSVSDIKLVPGTNGLSLTVWPVPSHGDFSVSLSGLKTNCLMKVFDIGGKLISELELEPEAVKRFRLSSPGVYMLNVFSKETGALMAATKVLVN